MWRLGRAKRANFDTSCGFDRAHLFVCGVEQTLRFAREAEPSQLLSAQERAEILGEMLSDEGQPLLTDEEVSRWFEQMRHDSSESPDQAPPERWLMLALDFGEMALAKQFFEDWTVGKEPTAEFWSSFAFYSKELHDPGGEAQARRELLRFETDPFRRASLLCNLLGSERRAGNPIRALEALEQAATLHRAHPDWRQLGLGRSFVEECFLLGSCGAPEPARRAFEVGDHFARKTPRLPIVALEAGVRAAQHVGNPGRERHYEALRQREERSLQALRARLPEDSDEP